MGENDRHKVRKTAGYVARVRQRVRRWRVWERAGGGGVAQNNFRRTIYSSRIFLVLNRSTCVLIAAADESFLMNLGRIKICMPARCL